MLANHAVFLYLRVAYAPTAQEKNPRTLSKGFFLILLSKKVFYSIINPAEPKKEPYYFPHVFRAPNYTVDTVHHNNYLTHGIVDNDVRIHFA